MARASQPQSKQKQQKSNASTAKGTIEMLRHDHRTAEQLFEQFERNGDDEQKEGLIDRICGEPACREAGVDEDKLDGSHVEHDGAKMLINDLLEAHADSDYFDAKVSVLKEMIRHHVEEEEEPTDGVFAQAKAHRVDDAGLGQRMARRKHELQRRGVGRRPARPVAIGMMGGRDRGRDLYGYGGEDRFRGENERGYGVRQRYDEDEYDGGYERSGRRSAGSEGDWNEARYGSREPEDYGRGYGRGPADHPTDHRASWFGDPRGHSDASRRG